MNALAHATYFDYDPKDLETIEMTMEEFEKALKEFEQQQEKAKQIDILIP